MKDRIQKLKEAATDLDSPPGGGHLSVDMDGDETQALIQQCAAVRANIAAIKTAVSRVAETHAQALAALSTQQAKQRRAELDDLMADVSRLAGRVRKDLKNMHTQIMTVPPADHGQAIPRMRQQQHAALSKNFAEVMVEYSDTQARYTQNCRNRMARQYKIVAPNASEAEVQAAVERGIDVFHEQILSAGHADAKQALEDIEDRLEDLVQVEVAMRELQMLMEGLAQHVNDQGGKLDNIAAHTAVATDYTEKAAVELEHAKRSKQAARKKMMAAGLLVAIVALVLALLLAFKLS